jgi:DNA polymerase III delta prime subunit
MEKTFSEILEKVNDDNLHTEVTQVMNSLKKEHYIFYGPSGVGKYSQALHLLSNFSPSQLSYEKKCNIPIDSSETPMYFKISDIHLEVNMESLGCNAKVAWHKIYEHINDIIAAKKNKVFFVVCHNFHKTHNDLLDIFYSYMSVPCIPGVKNPIINFIVLTTSLSSLPSTIKNNTIHIYFKRPTAIKYMNIGEGANTTISLNRHNIREINNIKDLNHRMNFEKPIQDKISHYLLEEEIDLTALRNDLYDILSYNVDIGECFFKLIKKNEERLKGKDYDEIITLVFEFYKNYNRFYRQIYHLEMFVLKLRLLISKNK